MNPEKKPSLREQLEKFSDDQLRRLIIDQGLHAEQAKVAESILTARNDSKEAGRHKESLAESKKANNLAWTAIGISALSLIISACPITCPKTDKQSELFGKSLLPQTLPTPQATPSLVGNPVDQAISETNPIPLPTQTPPEPEQPKLPTQEVEKN